MSACRRCSFTTCRLPPVLRCNSTRAGNDHAVSASTEMGAHSVSSSSLFGCYAVGSRFRAIIFGDRKEIACIPHAGCRLEIVATPASPHRKVNLLLPGQVIRYTHSFFLGDRFELPSGTKVSLRH